MAVTFPQRIKQQLVDTMPTLLRLPVSVTPAVIQSHTIAFALNRLFAEAISDEELDFLEGRWVELSISDIGGHWFITFAQGALKVSHQPSNQADVCFSGKLNDFVLMMGRREDSDTLFFQRRLVIEGDTELGLEVKNLIDNIDFDTLPVAAHHLLEWASGWVAEAAPSAV